MWHSFASAIIDKPDPLRITGRIRKLNHDLAKIGKNASKLQAPDIKSNGA